MEEAPENGKELSHSAHANGMNEWRNKWTNDVQIMHPTPTCILNDLAQTAQYQRIILFGTAAGCTGSMLPFRGTYCLHLQGEWTGLSGCWSDISYVGCFEGRITATEQENNNSSRTFWSLIYASFHFSTLYAHTANNVRTRHVSEH